MPYTVEDFERDYEEASAKMTPEERLRGLPPEEILKRMPRGEIEAYLRKLSKSN